MRKRYVLAAAAGITLLGLVAAGAVVTLRHTPAAVQTSQTSKPAPPRPKPGFDMQAHSTTDPASIWVIVNKRHPLAPKTFTPARLVVPNVPLRANITGDERQVGAAMAPALERLVADALAQGVHLNLQSGYRSYEFQVNLYDSYVRSQGQAAADRQSARPGYSEHQTGLAADLGGTSQPACNVAPCFASTAEGAWLAAHAYSYGFIVRYQADKEQVTGYEYEPWHIRYIGVELAGEMHRRDIRTLEEFFHVTGGSQYQ